MSIVKMTSGHFVQTVEIPDYKWIARSKEILKIVHALELPSLEDLINTGFAKLTVLSQKGVIYAREYNIG